MVSTQAMPEHRCLSTVALQRAAKRQATMAWYAYFFDGEVQLVCRAAGTNNDASTGMP